MNQILSTFPILEKSMRMVEIFLAVFILNIILRYVIKLPSRFSTSRAKTLFALIQNTISALVFLNGIYLILTVLNINITPILASAGFIGIFIGLGAQTLVKDLISGIVLITENTISIGDFVELGEHKGIVQKITLRTVILKDENGALRMIPAGKITDVVNFSRAEASIITDIPFSPVAKIDILNDIFKDEIKKITIDKRFEKILTRKPEFKGIQDIEPGKISLRVILFSNPRNQWRLKRELLYRIKKRLEKENIELK